jgi:RNA methyltransferase, TrmH family
MIPLSKLAKLAPKHRMRKTALVLGELERELLSGQAIDPGALSSWISGLAELLTREEDCPQAVRLAAAALGTVPSDLIRSIHDLRHSLLAATGQAPADWDLLDPRTGKPDSATRRLLPGLRAYLDDLRSPFNVGSVFRTADAFGLEELILSPSCADPAHPRAQRSAMGAVDLVPWKRASLESIANDMQIFALELGGTELEDFSFPARGIVVLGSEELGISREVKELCTSGTVSIPMYGAKGSLNVAVAFGILMYGWTSYLRR